MHANTHDIRRRWHIRVVYMCTCVCVRVCVSMCTRPTHACAPVRVCVTIRTSRSFVHSIISSPPWKNKKILNISESQPWKTIIPAQFFFFCFVRIFFFSPPGSNREKKGPHCSIVHIVSFFALEQRLFAAQLGTQWCSHKNEPLSSHTKLQIA